MNCPASKADSSSIKLFIFSSGGVFFAADAEQVENALPYNGEPGDDLFLLHEELGWRENIAEYPHPFVISVKTGRQMLYRLMIDAMVDIVETGCAEIHPLPAIIRDFALKRGVWGTVEVGGRTALLIDFIRLFRKRDSGSQQESA